MPALVAAGAGGAFVAGVFVSLPAVPVVGSLPAPASVLALHPAKARTETATIMHRKALPFLLVLFSSLITFSFHRFRLSKCASRIGFLVKGSTGGATHFNSPGGRFRSARELPGCVVLVSGAKKILGCSLAPER